MTKIDEPVKQASKPVKQAKQANKQASISYTQVNKLRLSSVWS